MRRIVCAFLLCGAAATAATAQGTKAAAPAPGGKAPVTQQDSKTAGRAQRAQRPQLTVAPESLARARAPVVMREVFTYDAEGRRDPFFSLLTTAELRPTIADLRLVGILYDPSGRRSVAVMRDLQTNAQYRVTTGSVLGRMRVSLIKPRSVIFTIEEFGLNRQDSLFVGDTTKVRAK